MSESSMQEIIERYSKLESALIYDTLDNMGLSHQQLSLEIQPLDIDMVIAGPAFTSKSAVSEALDKVQTDRVKTSGGGAAMREAMPEGCILVQDVGNDPVCGGLGENYGLTVKLAGCAGVVCDGGTRDKKAVIKMGLPVFSRFSTCTFSWGRRRSIDWGIPVRISGHLTKWVTVNPGDFIFGDCDGILVIPQELTVEVLEAAEKVAEIEEWQREQLKAGVPREEVYKVNRYAHVRRIYK